MGVSVTLPQMGESVTEGTVIQWLKSEGDTVAEDEPIVEISTDKIDTELPAPAAGVLAKILVGPDQTIDVGTELAIIEQDAGGPPPEDPEEAGETRSAPEEPAPEPRTPAPAPEPRTPAPAPEPERTQATPPRTTAPRAGRSTSPMVRKLAEGLGIDLDDVTPSSTSGRITREDVLAAARAGIGRALARHDVDLPPSKYQIPAEGHLDVPFDRVRRAIAEHMRRSRDTAAHVTNVVEVDMTAIAELRARVGDAFADREGIPLTTTPFIASAVVQALRTYPEFNAHIESDGSTARLYRDIDLGVAVGRDEGLIVPVISGAGDLSLIGLIRALADLGVRAQTRGGLTPADVAGGTFTISNYGALGSVFDTAIINQPQVAILGIGAVVKRPAVLTVEGVDTIAIRHLMMLSLCYDHRWLDGHQAARFNARIKQVLETGDFATDLGL